MNRAPIKLAVLISGSGTTLQNLIDRIRAGSLDAKIAAVVTSRAGIKGIDRARDAALPFHLVEQSKYSDTAAFSRDIFKICTDGGVELICLAGWLSLLDIPEAFAGRIMNIHPALLPSFGGMGMYGQRVHQAVLNHGCKVSGCTVHFVDRAYDNGPIILQRTCAVMEDDTPQTLAHRVFEEEKIAYPQAIQLFQDNRLRIDGRRVRII
ncbi:MAG: phosphoribosylglycinamide formyltransferase [Tepidisphaeraceae bacterium]